MGLQQLADKGLANAVRLVLVQAASTETLFAELSRDMHTGQGALRRPVAQSPVATLHLSA